MGYYAAVITPLQLLVGAQAYFIVLGKTRLEFNLNWSDILVVVATAIVAELLFAFLESHLRKQPYHPALPWSAVAAALGLAIFFRASHPLYFALAALLAIGSKYVVRIKGKHLFNPSNFAVVLMALVFPAATTIEFTQWGNSVAIYLLIASICLYVAYRAGVLVTTLSFLASYSVLLILSVLYHIDILAVHHYGLIGPSLVLFASFMITDPRTAPAGFYARVLHGIGVASGFFLLELLGIKYALFVASFLTTLLGVASAYSAAFLWEWRKITIPTNLFACLLLISSLLYVFVHTKPYKEAFDFQNRASLEFLLMGVEGGSIKQCSAHPLFVPTSHLDHAAPSMTTGIAWGDFDRDGREDLFISTIDTPSRLYRNTPEGFVDVTEYSGLPSFNSQSAFFADYDNNGTRDLFVVYGMQNYLAAAEGQPLVSKPATAVIRVFKNTGGHFTEVTEVLGFDHFTLPPSAGTLSFGDYNNDGFLDLVYAERATLFNITPVNNFALLKSYFEPYLNTAGNMVCERAQTETLLSNYAPPTLDVADRESFLTNRGCFFVIRAIPLDEQGTSHKKGDSSAVAGIIAYRPGSAHLFENRGAISFVEHKRFAENLHALIASTSAVYALEGEHPFDAIAGSFYQPVSFDYDEDGRIDIFLSTDWGTNLLMRNGGEFNFSNVTSEARMNYYGSGMGVDVADYTGDGTFDVVANNIRKIFLYRNNGDRTFTNEWLTHRLNELGTAWGMHFLDYDMDGWDDLFIGNGGIELTSNVPESDLSRPLYRVDKVYRNINGKEFKDTSTDAFCPSEGKLTRPAAIADYDQDGDVDMAVGYFAYGTAKTPPQLFQNQSTSTHYLAIELRGTLSNADAVGAVVSVTSNIRTQKKLVLSGSSFYAQASHRLLFGLGNSAEPVTVEIVWPSGKRTSLTQVPINQLLTITEPSS